MVEAGVPRTDWRIAGVVGIGGFFGGLARYGLMQAWPTPAHGFPWATLVANTAGTFVLAALVSVLVVLVTPPRYVRALIGTGFCGALTTFSSVVVSADLLAAHGHVPLAIGYVAASLAAGLAAAVAGITTVRGFAGHRVRASHPRWRAAEPAVQPASEASE